MNNDCFSSMKSDAIAAMRDFVSFSEYPKATPEILEALIHAKTEEEVRELQRKAGFPA